MDDPKGNRDPPSSQRAPMLPLAQLDGQSPLPLETVALAGGALVVLVVIVLVIRRLRRRKPAPPPPEEDLTLHLEELGEQGPPTGGPRLELYNLPMRLAGLVIAPAGRYAELPATDDLPMLLDQLVPGLEEIVRHHRTRLYPWPGQLSAQGFSHTFFANLALPDEGKGNPWSAIAGRFDARGQKYLAGLILRAAEDNSLGQLVLERETQWLDVLRVRR